MLKHKENSSSNGVSGGGITQSKETDVIYDENQANPGEISLFSEKGIGLSNKILDSKPLVSGTWNDDHNEPKGKSVVSEDHGDRNRWVERDFMQLSGSSSKREVEDDEFNVISRDKKPKLETLDLSLALPDVSLSLAASNEVRFGEPSVSLKPSRSLQSLPTNSNNTQTTFSMADSMSFSCSHPFSHNSSCSMTHNSTENYENSKIWNGGEGTNGSVHSRFRPVGDGGVVLVQANGTNSDNNLSLFPSELLARLRNDTQAGDSMGRGSNGTKPSRPEKILQEIVSESIPVMAQVIQELSDETLESTKDYLKKLIEIPERRDELVRLQLRLERRSDLTSENLSKANKNQLEILVSIRTVLGSFLSVQNRLPTNELIEIFLYESWVGCDVCPHWCHAACGLQKNLIKPGPSLKGPTGTTEIQFHCIGCGHASEMFGFVKDVFKFCAEEWSLETLMKELDCVRKIFRGSSDFKGKELYSKAGEMVSNLDNKAMSPSDVCSFIIQFFNYTDGISEFPTSNLPSTVVPPSKPPSQMMNSNNMMIEDEWSVKSTKKDRFDSVESLVRIKEAEARMFQKKADEARKEAEGYKRMIRIKIEKLDEEYTQKLSKLCLNESEERKKQKVEEFKVLENGHCEYYKMKMRMQAEIAGLLQRMENTKKQWV
ncbi:protein OBERON 3-like isoform X2 [Cynara cardunculus var. scolymus]|uniref:protein OBERON 3-like isoform X2 n=1 Tax=Cynara cardunculus var. scolymus TaxID=59895 RepID=UPI000D62BBD6|nr:protein OBERON 3-like isoform X2 [Cynara cardunculus var. scolymus]